MSTDKCIPHSVAVAYHLSAKKIEIYFMIGPLDPRLIVALSQLKNKHLLSVTETVSALKELIF